MIQVKKILLLICLLGTGWSARAQTEPVFLTLDSAISLSLAESKRLKMEQADVDIAQARYGQAKSRELPTATLSGSYIRLSDNVDPYLLQLPGAEAPKSLFPQIVNRYTPTLSVSQLVYGGGQVHYAKRATQLLAEASRLDLERSKTEVTYQTIEAYFQLFKLQQTKILLEQNRAQVHEHVRDISSYQRNGLALKNDVLQIELQASALDHSLLEINHALDNAYYDLSIRLGLPTASTFALNPADVAPARALKDLTGYQQEALLSRPDLKAVDKRIGSSVLGVKSAQAHYFPTLSAGVNYYYLNPNARVFPQTPDFKATWDASLTLRWNIHSLYTNQHRLRENRAALAKAQSQKEQLLDEVNRQVHDHYLSLLELDQKIEVSELEVRQAEENYQIIRNRFRNNTVLTSDLTDATHLLLQAKIHLVVDRANAGLAYYQLRQATGFIHSY